MSETKDSRQAWLYGFARALVGASGLLVILAGFRFVEHAATWGPDGGLVVLPLAFLLAMLGLALFVAALGGPPVVHLTRSAWRRWPGSHSAAR